MHVKRAAALIKYDTKAVFLARPAPCRTWRKFHFLAWAPISTCYHTILDLPRQQVEEWPAVLYKLSQFILDKKISFVFFPSFPPVAVLTCMQFTLYSESERRKKERTENDAFLLQSNFASSPSFSSHYTLYSMYVYTSYLSLPGKKSLPCCCCCSWYCLACTLQGQPFPIINAQDSLSTASSPFSFFYTCRRHYISPGLHFSPNFLEVTMAPFPRRPWL